MNEWDELETNEWDELKTKSWTLIPCYNMTGFYTNTTISSAI